MEGVSEKLEPRLNGLLQRLPLNLLFYLTLQILRSYLLMIVNSDTLSKTMFPSSQPPLVFYYFCFL